MRTLRLDFLGPNATPIRVELPMSPSDQVHEPHFVVVSLLADGCATLCAQYRADADPECFDDLDDWLSQRLTRLFNPDGSEPDYWRVRRDGLGLDVWVRNAGEMPPLDVTVDADVPQAERI